MPNSLKYLDVAERVLAKHQRPLRARDLINLGIEDGFVESWDSNTPQKSMQSRLSMDILRKGKESRFIRTERGRFYLRGLLGAPLSLDDDLLFPSESTQHYAKPFTTVRRLVPSPMEHVLTVSQEGYQKVLNFQGIRDLGERNLKRLMNPKTTSYVPRILAETLDDRKQVLTYVLVRYKNKVLSFRRGAYNNTAAFLRGSRCIGFGGHVTEHDHTLFTHEDLGIASSALRELAEELRPSNGFRALLSGVANPQLSYLGVLNDDSSEVGRRHLAIVFEYRVRDWTAWARPTRGEASINQLQWIDLKFDKVDLNEFEYWSQLCWREFFRPIADAQPSFRIVRKRPFEGPHLLAVTGTIGSGKSAATEFFKDWLGYDVVNTGKILARLIGLPPIPRSSRRRFQDAATKFINSRGGPRRLAREICRAAASSKKQRVVVDGIRHRETLSLVRQIADRDVAVLYVQAAPDIAYKLYASRERNSITSSQFFELYSASVESDVRYLIQDADAVVYNWTGRDEYDAVLDRLSTELGLYDRRS